MMPTSPFLQHVPKDIPKVMRPLRYCEFRVILGQEDVGLCPVFACTEDEGMWFCNRHHDEIQAAIQAEEGRE